jgi:hypothetical protein
MNIKSLGLSSRRNHKTGGTNASQTLATVLTFLAGLLSYHSVSAQPPPGYTPPSAPAPGAPPYAADAGLSTNPEAFNTNNCGTPDQPKPCPPMPRHPLPYYPANKK